ncbi:MAG: PcfJ domain-containing protein [Treponema sp.]|nr:PcfJ domain-containing protein [Treponema sp.]
MRPEISDLLIGFNPTTAEKKHLFWKRYDEQKKDIERGRYAGMPYDWQERFENILKDWRSPVYHSLRSLPQELYIYLKTERNHSEPYPEPIPYCLFFTFKDNEEAEKKRWLGDLADKWLKDVFSGESFYEQNKEYFSRSEVKHFLTCEWQKLEIEKNYFSPSTCFGLIIHYFNAKIEANGLKMSAHAFVDDLEDCCSFEMAIEYFNFICNNKKYIKDTNFIDVISKYVKSEYIKLKKNIDFNAITYQGLKLLSDEWHILGILKYKFNDYCEKRSISITKYFYSLTVEGYFHFILKNIKKIEDRGEISDISDYLKHEYIDTGIDFDFNNRTWQSIKRLSDEWHLQNRIEKEPHLKKLIDTEWKKSSVRDFSHEKDGEIWVIQEITSGKLLYEESQSMHHCCFSYIEKCIRGQCIIFSVKCKSNDEKNEKRIATVEVSKNMEIIQARGEYNRHVGKKTEDIIKQWASENEINFNYISSRNIDFN